MPARSGDCRRQRAFGCAPFDFAQGRCAESNRQGLRRPPRPRPLVVESRLPAEAGLTMAQRISVRVPATSANLGCAFDCAALALNLYLDISVAPRADKEVTVAYRGVNPDRIPTDRTNMIVSTMLNALAGWHKERGFDLEISNQIPVGVGLGSSAAAIVGGLAASHYLADATLCADALVSLASRLEGHPDNVAAAWHACFTVTAEEGGRAWAYSCPVPEPIQFVVVVPDFAVSTEKARQV